jgi:hypothetical protein
MSLGQVCKLPIFFSHFKEHKERDKKVTLLDFLSMHYWGKDIDDNDQETDMKLPFKDFSNNTVQQPFCPLLKTFTLKSFSYSHKKDFQVRKENLLPDPILSSLLRPPIV